MLFTRAKTRLPESSEALPGRADAMPVPARHDVLGNPLTPPFPEGLQTAVFGLGCFWGAERLFWQVPGVWTTAVGYAGGLTPNPTYAEPYHQQYLAKNPGGYCGLGGTGVSCPVGLGAA